MNIINNIQVYWINLDSAIERSTFMVSQFNQYNILNNKKISAIDANKLDQIYVNKSYPCSRVGKKKS